MRWKRLLACMLFYAPGLAAQPAPAAEPRYVAVFADGNRAEGNELNSWSYPGEMARLDGTELLNLGRPLRWLRDQTLGAFDPAGDVTGYVELIGGDRLPGRLVEFIETEEEEEPPAESLNPDPRARKKPAARDRTKRVPEIVKTPEEKKPAPPHLTVTIELPHYLPAEARSISRIRVLPRYVRRVVWGKGPAQATEPGTLLFRDGRRTTFQGLRWQRDSVRVLSDEGIRQAAFSELTEVHLPRGDAWQDYCRELTDLKLEANARLVRVETSRGLIITTAESGLRPSGVGGDRPKWFHVAQPAWSLDPIWVRVLSIRARMYFAPTEIPLCRWPPVRFVSRPLLGQGWFWQMDRNVEGGLLASEKQLHGWGLGVHAPCELWFEIPKGVEGFRTRAGLDRLAGTGGCARACIYVNQPGGQQLFQSKHLVGSTEVVDPGKLSLGGPDRGQKYLVLVADAAERDRPSGTDPLDIRDTLDWIEPMFTIDRQKLAEATAPATPAKAKP